MSDKTRREFLRSCFRIGGYAGIACLGMGAIEDARGWGILPAIIGSGGGNIAPYDRWNETTQTVTDVDYCCIHDGASSENDVGYSGTGALTGDALVLTQAGNIVAGTATGGYWSRHMDATDDRMEAPAAMRAVIAQATCSLIMKFRLHAIGAEYNLLYWYAGAGDSIAFYIDNAANQVQINSATNAGFSAASGILYTLSAGVDYWFVYQCNGVNNAWIGIATSKPTKKTDCVATKDGDGVCSFSDLSGTADDVWGYAGGVAGRFFDGLIYYFLLHSEALLTE